MKQAIHLILLMVIAQSYKAAAISTLYSDNLISTRGKQYLVLDTDYSVDDHVKEVCHNHEPRSKQENRFLDNLDAVAFSLGMNDTSTAGQWAWESDGSAVTRNSWCWGKPQHKPHRGHERDCAVMIPQMRERKGGDRADGWNDVLCETNRYMRTETTSLIGERKRKPECPAGRYGDKCTQTCSSHCAGHGLCHKITGHCLSGCHTDYHGDKCEDECSDGHFGQQCNEKCSSHCGGDGLCHKVTGHCLNGCHSGYHGDKCEDVNCPQGWTRGLNTCVKQMKRGNYRRAKQQCVEAGASLVGPSTDKDLMKKVLNGIHNVWLANDKDECRYLSLRTGKDQVAWCNKKCRVLCVLEVS